MYAGALGLARVYAGALGLGLRLVLGLGLVCVLPSCQPSADHGLGGSRGGRHLRLGLG